MYSLLVDEVFLNNELLRNAQYVTERVVERKRRSHLVEDTHQEDRENEGHVLHHRVVGVLWGHVPVVHREEQARQCHQQGK